MANKMDSGSLLQSLWLRAGEHMLRPHMAELHEIPAAIFPAPCPLRVARGDSDPEYITNVLTFNVQVAKNTGTLTRPPSIGLEGGIVPYVFFSVSGNSCNCMCRGIKVLFLFVLWACGSYSR